VNLKSSDIGGSDVVDLLYIYLVASSAWAFTISLLAEMQEFMCHRGGVYLLTAIINASTPRVGRQAWPW